MPPTSQRSQTLGPTRAKLKAITAEFDSLLGQPALVRTPIKSAATQRMPLLVMWGAPHQVYDLDGARLFDEMRDATVAYARAVEEFSQAVKTISKTESVRWRREIDVARQRVHQARIALRLHRDQHGY